MLKTLVLALLVALALGRSYPLYKQCDSRWANEELGTSGDTICRSGCAMSSVSMGLSGIGIGFNPSSLNNWLRDNGGYYDGGELLWGSVNRLGLIFEGKYSNDAIREKLDQDKVVIVNVRGGSHWVLVTGYSGSTLYVNDSGFSNSSYDISECINGQAAVYRA